MDKLTRKDLKTDKFAQEVTHSIEYVAGHRKQATTYGLAALGVVLALVAIYAWRKSSSAARQDELAAAFRTQMGVINVNPSPEEGRPAFPTKEAKDAAIKKAFEDIVAKHGGTVEAHISHLTLGAIFADKGDLAEAEKHFRIVAGDGSREYASGAKFALAQIYGSQGKTADAERLLRDLVDNPTAMISKEQAVFALARLLSSTKPTEVGKMLEPFQTDQRESVSRAYAQLLTELPATAQPLPPPADPAAKKK